MNYKNVFIYLIAFPGTGKLTIARELQKEFPSILVDNHFINNIVFKLIDTDGVTKLSERVWHYTEETRKIVLNVIRELSKPDRNFIFTNALMQNDPTDLRLYNDIVKLSNDRNAYLLPVCLIISKEELCRRVISPDRKVNLKGINPEEASVLWDKHNVFTPEGSLTLDVSSLTPDKAANAIKVELERRIRV